jgi:curved DNA-binding protein CbpA
MGFEPDARLVLQRGVDLRTLPLTPVDFFVYSRVEALDGAKPSVADIIAASGQSEAVASASLQKLIELGVITLSAATRDTPGRAASESPRGSSPTPTPTPTPTSTPTSTQKPTPTSSPTMTADLRERARNRLREALEAQLRVAQETKLSPSHVPSNDETALTPREDQRAEPGAFVLGSILDDVEPVAETDPRLEPGATVDLDRQRRLLALRDRLRHVGHFELFGLEPTDDLKLIRRAYHVIGREFHPDSFYGKNLGGFGEVLDALFRRVRTSYEFLLDPERRRPLVEAHQIELRAEQERRERELAAQAESRQKAERAQEEREAQQARAVRDRERKLRIRDRAIDKRREQASQHAEQAQREQESGRFGTAATLFRLAYEQDPDNAAYEQQWREALSIARRQRAEVSFAQAKDFRKAGRPQDAARLFADAAEADPTLRNLTEATSAMAEVDPARARELAMSALETLQQAQARGVILEERAVVGVHQACAKAFLVAGQLASAREQAERAHAIAPSPLTRTLLNSIKLT